MVRRVILDSSFLIDATRFHINIIDGLNQCTNTEVEPVVLSVTLSELVSTIKRRGSKASKEISLAFGIAQKFPFIEVKKKQKERVDDVIQRVAMEQQWFVATNDRTLRRKLRDNNVTTIFVRQKSRLECR